MSRSLIIWSAILLSSCYISDDVAPDESVWEYAAPSEVDLNDDNLLQLDADIKSEEYDKVTGLIIVKDDKLVFENYYDSQRGELKPIGRASLICAILLLDHFISQGYISGLDAPIYQYLPEYESAFENDIEKRQITIRHLLIHRSGLSWNEGIVNTERSESDIWQMKRSVDWAGYVLNKQLEAPPGLRTSINSAHGILLAKIYQNVLKETSLTSVIDELLFQPLGIKEFLIEQSRDSTLDLANGIWLSTMDYAKIGYLILQEGRWKDRVRVINRDWVLDMISVQNTVSYEYSYGYGWWIFTPDFINLRIPSAENCFFISGGSGENLYLLPDLNMLVCISAENPFSGTIYNKSLVILLETLRQEIPQSSN